MADSVEIQLNQGRLPARLAPFRFFITSSVLDLTIVGLDSVDSKTNSHCHQPHYLKTCCTPNLDLGSTVYILSYVDKKELAVGEGKVVIATDNLIKLSAEGRWSPGSAGFDAQGNLAMMICDPMRLASSPAAKSSSASSSLSQTCKGDSSMLFAIPIPIICDWLHQHWEGSLDELSKPKLPLIRLLSTGQKSELSSASFTHRQIFKPADEDDADISCSVRMPDRSRYNQELSGGLANTCSLNGQGISTPEIYEYPRITSEPFRKKESGSIQLLDINFPPRAPRSIVLPAPLKQQLPEPIDNESHDSNLENLSIYDDYYGMVQSSSFSPEVSELMNEDGRFSSGEETMYSAETMESRNIPSPPKDIVFHQVGRSQSCVNYERWTSSSHRNSTRRGMTEERRTVSSRKTQSHAPTISQKSHEYYGQTVSSSMKKRDGSGQPPVRPRRQNVNQDFPRWVF